jgi:hypothetical protein
MHAEAEAMRRKLNGAFSAYWGAEIYAQRGDTAKALEGLETIDLPGSRSLTNANSRSTAATRP